MKVVEAIADAICREGSEVAFNLPDEVTVHLAQALHERGVRIVRARHEQNAVAMADGFARSNGLAVCSIGGGPALAQTGNALVTAQRRGSGILIFVGGNPPGHIKEFDTKRFAESLGIRYVGSSDASRLAEDLAKAFRLVRQDKGPVLFEMGDLACLHGDTQGNWAYESVPRAPAYPEPSIDSAIIAEIAAVLANAKRPLIIAGRGAVRSGSGSAIEMLADRLGALLGTSLQARGYFDRHGRGIGIVGGFGTETAAQLFRKADCILAVGIAFNSYQMEMGFAPGVKILQIDTDGSRIGRFIQVSHGVVADARAAVVAIDECLERAGHIHTGGWTRDEIASLSTHASPASEPPGEGDRMSVPEVLARVEQVLPADRVIIVDAGRFLGPTLDIVSVPGPESWFWTCDFGSIGLGLAMGIGVQVARREQPCLVIVGDGGFMMNIQELETAVRERIPLGILVLDNSAYAAEVHFLRALDKAPDLAQFDEVDFAGVARAFGAEAVTIRGLDDLSGAAARIGAGSMPFVIDAKVAIESPHRAFSGHREFAPDGVIRRESIPNLLT